MTTESIVARIASDPQTTLIRRKADISLISNNKKPVTSIIIIAGTSTKCQYSSEILLLRPVGKDPFFLISSRIASINAQLTQIPTENICKKSVMLILCLCQPRWVVKLFVVKSSYSIPTVQLSSAPRIQIRALESVVSPTIGPRLY